MRSQRHQLRVSEHMMNNISMTIQSRIHALMGSLDKFLQTGMIWVIRPRRILVAVDAQQSIAYTLVQCVQHGLYTFGAKPTTADNILILFLSVLLTWHIAPASGRSSDSTWPKCFKGSCSPSEKNVFFNQLKIEFGLKLIRMQHKYLLTKKLYFSFKYCADWHYVFASTTGGS